MSAAILAGAFVLLCTSALLLGRGGQGEFSPDTLEARTQREYLIPLTEIPIYRGSFERTRWPIADFLVTNGYWSAAKSAEPCWMETFRWNRQWRDGESTLYRELVWHGDQWIQWTKDHPDLAKLMWPRLLEVLRGSHNTAASSPEAVLFGAQSSSTPAEYKALLGD